MEFSAYSCRATVHTMVQDLNQGFTEYNLGDLREMLE
jgi:hypothetical protein